MVAKVLLLWAGLVGVSLSMRQQQLSSSFVEGMAILKTQL